MRWLLYLLARSGICKSMLKFHCIVLEFHLNTQNSSWVWIWDRLGLGLVIVLGVMSID